MFWDTHTHRFISTLLYMYTNMALYIPVTSTQPPHLLWFMYKPIDIYHQLKQHQQSLLANINHQEPLLITVEIHQLSKLSSLWKVTMLHRYINYQRPFSIANCQSLPDIFLNGRKGHRCIMNHMFSHCQPLLTTIEFTIEIHQLRVKTLFKGHKCIQYSYGPCHTSDKY